MQRRGDSRGDRNVPAAKDSRRERREHENRERADGGVGGFRRAGAFRMAQSDEGEEERIARCPEVEGLRRLRIPPRFDERPGRVSIRAGIAKLGPIAPDPGDRREARPEREEEECERDPAMEPRERAAATRGRTLPSRASS
jgi:hypothetical protein